MCPIKPSKRRSPRNRKSQGNRNGLTRSTVNMLFSGAALLVSIIFPPSLGPHHKVFLPNENCQLPRLSPTYVSSRRKRLMEVTGRAGPVGQLSVRLKKSTTACVGADAKRGN